MNYGTEQNIVIQIHFSQFQKYVDMICAENNIQQHLAPPNINDGMLVGNQIRKPKTGLRCTTQCHIYPLKGGKSTNFNVLADLSTKLFTTEVRFWLKDKTLQKTSYFFFFFLKKKEECSAQSFVISIIYITSFISEYHQFLARNRFVGQGWKDKMLKLEKQGGLAVSKPRRIPCLGVTTWTRMME